MKNILKIASATIALTAIGVAVRAKVKKQESDMSIDRSKEAFQQAEKAIKAHWETYQYC